MISEVEGWFALFARTSRFLIHVLLCLSGASILGMVVVVSVDVVCRKAGFPIKGSVEVVGILGALAIACALPYTTAVKGHVAIEFFFQKLPRRGRIVVDTLTRSVVLLLFAVLSRESVLYAQSLKASNQVTPTLQFPLFWIPWVFAFCFAMVVTVKVYHLLRPGRTMVKP